jgi:hypothetical protein
MDAIRFMTATIASFKILPNSSFTYHTFIRRYIFLVNEEAPLKKIKIYNIVRLTEYFTNAAMINIDPLFEKLNCVGIL